VRLKVKYSAIDPLPTFETSTVTSSSLCFMLPPAATHS